ncbi:Sec-independent protein translocase protein TatB [Rhizobium sp. LCM 4573]|uniref:Sec-independent protein translocase protein TatB n=1 Tax=Rhizobium sp. LCM 4573 TaxID=1848291 RepID=UPI0008D9F26D|nr:Sec-independent protein translocase protein TatB [Rhizobium sp. LCM 4573]OHV81711.1 twin arginine-targeting protein translocase TatB [Rhizobium sp. LCM 4573]
MLDIGWTELLVIAIVLIVVVGPKDLPPMLRAFGKMTANLRKMAGEFRSQFDEALRETELDEVRQTISDAQKLNPSNALRDAINPLRQMGQEIRSDLQKATQVPAKADAEPQAPAEGEAAKPEPALAVPASGMTLPSAPPETLAPAAAAKPKRVSQTAAKAKPADAAPQAAAAEKPKRSRAAAKPAPLAKAEEKASVKAPARKRASKKIDTPKDDA